MMNKVDIVDKTLKVQKSHFPPPPTLKGLELYRKLARAGNVSTLSTKLDTGEKTPQANPPPLAPFPVEGDGTSDPWDADANNAQTTQPGLPYEIEERIAIMVHDGGVDELKATRQAKAEHYRGLAADKDEATRRTMDSIVRLFVCPDEVTPC